VQPILPSILSVYPLFQLMGSDRPTPAMGRGTRLEEPCIG